MQKINNDKKKQMRKICIIVIVGIMVSCGRMPQESLSSYKDEKTEEIKRLLNELDQPTDRIDTLYAEMYVALKESPNDSSARNIVIEKVYELLKLDTIISNQRHYMDALAIVYSLNKDYDNLLSTSFKIWNTYPYESLERLSSYAMYYTLRTQNEDSAKIYCDKVLKYGSDSIKSINPRKRESGYIAISSVFMAKGNKTESKKFLSKCLETEPDSMNISLLQDLLNNYDEYAKTLLEPINKL